MLDNFCWFSFKTRRVNVEGVRKSDKGELLEHVGKLISAICTFIEKRGDTQTTKKRHYSTAQVTIKKEIEVEIKDIEESLNNIKSLFRSVFSNVLLYKTISPIWFDCFSLKLDSSYLVRLYGSVFCSSHLLKTFWHFSTWHNSINWFDFVPL